MDAKPVNPKIPPTARGFCRDSGGAVTIETLIVLPLMFWALVATLVFFDGFRSRNQTQVAAQTVADLLSREANMFTINYLEGMNDVFDFISDTRFPTRMRISSIIWNSTDEINALQWSYGTRGLSPLPEDTFTLLAAGDYATLQTRFGTSEEFSFAGSAAQAPQANLAERIPPVLPGEALILVESMALWSPWFNVGLGRIRFDPVVVTRPRFTPWVHLEGSIPVYPEDNYEVAIAGYVPSLPEPEPEPEPEPTGPTVVVNTSFDAGVPADWSHTAVTTTSRPGTGSYLGRFGGETWTNPVTYGVNLGAPMATARIEFDLLIIDSWDGYNPQYADPEGDVLSILIDGTPITVDSFWHETGRFTDNDRYARVSHLPHAGSVYTVNMTRTQSGTNFSGASNWHDQIWRVTIDVEAPPESFTLGFSARLSQAINDESFGIDNFSITATPGTPALPDFVPDAATLNGTFPLTRFPRHAGCPDFRLAANWLTLRNADLTQTLSFTRRPGGSRNLQSCSEVNGSRFAYASPHFVLNYINDTSDINGNRLRIRMEDGNGGRSCDSTLLIRDPTGLWWFNDDLPGHGWNAGLNMGNVPTGAYHVWIGSWSNGQCNSDVQVILERY